MSSCGKGRFINVSCYYYIRGQFACFLKIFDSFLSIFLFVCLFVFLLEPSPWYNHNGWLGVKHQLTYLLTVGAASHPPHSLRRPNRNRSWLTWLWQPRVSDVTVLADPQWRSGLITEVLTALDTHTKRNLSLRPSDSGAGTTALMNAGLASRQVAFRRALLYVPHWCRTTSVLGLRKPHAPQSL